MSIFTHRCTLLTVSVVLFALASPATAQPKTPQELLEDFAHYSLTANVQLASDNAQALLDLPLTDAELAIILDEGSANIDAEKFERAISRAQMVPELEDIASELARRIEVGRLDLARDAKRINEAIAMLVGTQRAKLLAKNRLIAAGEYAVPALLRQVTEGTDESLKLAGQDMIRQIGRQAVTPLCESLRHLGAVNQRIVCDLLGDIGWHHAAPYLREISLDDTISGPVRDAASRAFANVQGVDTDLSTLYTIQGRQYFKGIESLIAYPTESSNNIWSYDAFVGLVATPVPTVIYSEVMSMRMVGKALDIDPGNAIALSLFVGANLRRENNLPEGESDPIFGDLNYSPDFYATVFGTQICQDVLGMALDEKDTPLVRDAIAALSKTTGGSNLFSGTGRRPLLECLEYPDRRVQYEAALTLAQALPREGFDGDFWIVPLLSSAVRTGSQMFALVIADDREDQQTIANRLSSLGYSIVGQGASVREVNNEIQESTGVDLVVIQRNTANRSRETVQSLSLIPRTAVAPILISAAQIDRNSLKEEYRGHPRVSVVRVGLSEEALASIIESLMARGAGGRITEEEAEAYAIDALIALRDIAISHSPVYNIGDALSSLRDALDVRTGTTRLWVADILALIPDQRAQRKLFDDAMVDGDDQQIDLLERAAESVKRYGNMIEQRHIDALIDLIMNTDGEIAEAASRVHGSLNLPAGAALELIPN